MRGHLCRRRSLALSPEHPTIGGPNGQLPAAGHGRTRRRSADNPPRLAKLGFMRAVLWRYDHQLFLYAQREPQDDRIANRVPERYCAV